MTVRTLTFSSDLPVPVTQAWDWHTRAGAFERMAPPWSPLRIESAHDGLRDGARMAFRLARLLPPRRWVAEIRDVLPGRSFVDVQVAGPFAAWRHLHELSALDVEACRIDDRVTYSLPLGFLGDLFAGRFVRRELERVFTHRHEVLARDLRRHHPTSSKGPVMKIAVSGTSGLVGSALVPFLTSGGHEVVRLVRRTPQKGEIHWDPKGSGVDAGALAGCDAIVHLAGENIGGGRWTAARKERIRTSRSEGTRKIAEAIAALPDADRPRVLVCASAIGLYGDRGEESLDERSPRGKGFLADVVAAWEEACEPAREAGVRVVNTRFGVILSPAGGALRKMLLPFKLGAGGRIGSGRQWMSWVDLEDAVGALHHALVTPALAGPVNVVAPEVARNSDYTKTLAAVLGRPAIVPMPAFAARLAFGEMADELLLASTKVESRKLIDSGFSFAHPDLEGALRSMLGKGPRKQATLTR